jgi:hypothetical protein
MKRPTPITDEARFRRKGETPYQWRLRRLETMRDLERKLAEANAALKAAYAAPHATELARIGELVGMEKHETVFGAVKRRISDSTQP